MADPRGGSAGGAGAYFYSFDYTTYNPNEEGFVPQYQTTGEPQFFQTMAGFNPGEGTFQTIPGPFDSRLRRISDFEPVKHKRSRNGCYTCRSRRVKCDEERPRCGRCAKSKRECVFPELPKNASSKDAPAKSSDEEKHSPENEEGTSSNTAADKSDMTVVTPSNDDSLHPPSYQTSPMSEHSELMMDVSGFPEDMYHWMEYFKRHVSHHHYGFIDEDEGNALRSFLAQNVYNDNALMFAVVAFCAFLRTVALGRNSLEDFLGFYNSSMSMLRTSLFGGNRLSITTLATVLQLALLEEYLGDWVNLQSHQKAALSIITEMFDPRSIAEEPSNRILLHWYIRFDQFTSFISHNETSLSMAWWEADCTLSENDKNMVDKDKLVRLRCEKDMRWLTKDISALFARIGTDPAAVAADSEKFETLNIRLESWRHEFEVPLLHQAGMPISPTSTIPPKPPTGDANEQRRTWAAKHLLVHFWNLQLIFHYLLAMVQQQMPSEDFSVRAKRNCDLMQDIIENDPHPDAIIGIRGPLAIHGIALGHDPEKAAWCQNQLSHIESRGYLYPSTFRKHVPDNTGNVMEAETEGSGAAIKPMIQVVREWIDERSNTAHDTQTENIRQMAGIFRPLEESSPRGL